MAKDEEMESIKKAVKKKTKDTAIDNSDKFGRAQTGCLLHDLQAGGEKGKLGYPYGRIVDFYAPKSSGKTFVAHEIEASIYWKNKKKVNRAYWDVEEGDSFDTQKLYNMPSSNVEEPPETIQEMDAQYKAWLRKQTDDKPSIAFIDSLDSLSSTQVEEMSTERGKLLKAGKTVADKGSYAMEKAKFISTHFFPTIVNKIARKKSLLFLISQVRTDINPNSYATETIAGGVSMPFYCHTMQRMQKKCEIYLTEKHKKDGVSSGFIMEMINKKSKTPRPYRKIHLMIFREWGVDDTGTSLLFLYELLTDTGQMPAKKDLKDIEWEGEKYNFWKLRDKIDEDDDLKKLLDKKVIEKWEEREDKSLEIVPSGGSRRKYE